MILEDSRKMLFGFCVFAAALQKPPADPVAAMVGRKAPAARLVSSTGEKVDVGKRFGKQPVVIVIYRGVW